MPLFLKNTNMPARRYIILAWVIAFFPTLLISAVVQSIFETKNDLMGQGKVPAFIVFIGMVVFAPVVETIIMAIVIWILRRFTRKDFKIIIFSAIFWAILHSLSWLPWGFIIFWPFIVFSAAYVYWSRKSVIKALMITTCIHAMVNFIPGVLTFIYLVTR